MIKTLVLREYLDRYPKYGRYDLEKTDRWRERDTEREGWGWGGVGWLTG